MVRLICQIPDEPRPQQTIIGVDLGGNTLIAATDGQKVVLISGRKAKATIQYRNTQWARLSAQQSQLTKGSRRGKRVQRRKYRMLDKSRQVQAPGAGPVPQGNGAGGSRVPRCPVRCR